MSKLNRKPKNFSALFSSLVLTQLIASTSYRSRLFSKSAYTLVVRLFAPALAFEMIGSSGLILSMGFHYLLTNMVAWSLHYNHAFSPWVRIRIAFVAMICGGLTLFAGSLFSNPILVIAAAGIFGIYEAFKWTAWHQVREDEHGSSKEEVARWNTFEKSLAAFFLFVAAFWSDYAAPELCMALGLIFAIFGLLNTPAPSSNHPSLDPELSNFQVRKRIYLFLPFLEGVAAVSWVFFLRLISLDGTLSNVPLIGTGIISLGIITGTTALLGAFMYYISHRYKWKLSMEKTLPLQIMVVSTLIFLAQNEYWILALMLMMSLLRSMMMGQSVNDFRKLLALSGSVHDTRERMKFFGRVVGLFFILPDFNSIQTVLYVHLASITILLVIFYHCSGYFDEGSPGFENDLG